MPTEPAFFVPASEQDRLRFSRKGPSSFILPWGEGEIIFHQDGRLILEGYDSLDAAAQAFWEAVARWKPVDWTVTLPWQQE